MHLPQWVRPAARRPEEQQTGQENPPPGTKNNVFVPEPKWTGSDGSRCDSPVRVRLPDQPGPRLRRRPRAPDGNRQEGEHEPSGPGRYRPGSPGFYRAPYGSKGKPTSSASRWDGPESGPEELAVRTPDWAGSRGCWVNRAGTFYRNGRRKKTRT